MNSRTKRLAEMSPEIAKLTEILEKKLKLIHELSEAIEIKCGWGEIAIEWHCLANRTAQESSLDRELGHI